MNLGTFSVDKNAKKVNLNFQVKISFNPNEELSAENLKVEVVNNTPDVKNEKLKTNRKKKPNVFTNIWSDHEDSPMARFIFCIMIILIGFNKSKSSFK